MNDDAYTLDFFFESWELFRDAALTSTIAGVLLGFLGVYVVLRRMVFLSAALTQTASFGVALAFLLKVEILYWATFDGRIAADEHDFPPPDGLLEHFGQFMADPYIMAAVVTGLVTLWVVKATRSPRTRSDSLLGFIYLVGAAGTLLVGTRIAEELQDIQSLLVGNAVAVLPEDLSAMTHIAVVVLLLHIVAMRGMIQASFDPDGARVRGLPVAALDVLLLGSLALAVVVATAIIGALPVFAFSVLPAMAAIRLSHNVPMALMLAAAIGGAAGFGGYIFSFLYEFPVGASQAVVAAGLVVVAEGVQQSRRLVEGIMSRRASEAETDPRRR